MPESDEQKPQDDSRNGGGHRDPDPLVEIASRLTELKAFVSHLAHVKVDQARLWTRQLVLTAIVGGFVAICLAVFVAIAAIHVARGAALGLTELFNGNLWAGYLVAGILLLLLVALGGAIAIAATSRRREHELIEKYEQKRDHQESELGFTVDDAAAAAATPDGARTSETRIRSSDPRDAGNDRPNA